jgi:hypothetical protein
MWSSMMPSFGGGGNGPGPTDDSNAARALNRRRFETPMPPGGAPGGMLPAAAAAAAPQSVPAQGMPTPAQGMPQGGPAGMAERASQVMPAATSMLGRMFNRPAPLPHGAEMSSPNSIWSRLAEQGGAGDGPEPFGRRYAEIIAALLNRGV